jgi:sugar O-acyltransferase (sialic acid O-acetyltransferase NeuD family)
MEKIVVIGAGGFGREVLWLLRDINNHAPAWDVVGMLDDYADASQIDGVPLLGKVQRFAEFEDCRFVIAFGSPESKASVVREHLAQLDTSRFATLVHPTAIVADSAVIGPGGIVCAYSVISINATLGAHVSVNISCTIGHDSVLGDFCSVMPGSNISGNVRLGQAVYMGTGAKIIHRVDVGDESTVGAGSVVIKSIEAKQTVFGNPARATLHK